MSRPSYPIATAIKDSLKQGYTAQTVKADLGAAVVVSLIALPLSMALSIAVGLPPQHGLYTAIVAGIVTALLGGSKVQVSGPTAAFVAILAPIVTQYGLDGLIWCQLMAGALLLLMGAMRLGRYIEHVPFAVTTGFTAGIAVVIATLALNDFLGLHIEKTGPHYIDKLMAVIHAVPYLTPQEAVIGFVCLITIIGFRKITTKIPAPVAGIGLATVLALVSNAQGWNVSTIETTFSYIGSDGSSHGGIPPYLPALHFPPMMDVVPLLWPALTVALLAALESLLSATVADNITEDKHDPNAELTGIGFGNLLSGLFAGIPATGAIARTAANIQAGGKTPVASALHAVFLLIYMLALAPYISMVPMAALASLLLVTAWRMAHIHLIAEIIKAGNKKETAVLSVTFILTVFVDMVVGVGAGLALFYLLKKIN